MKHTLITFFATILLMVGCDGRKVAAPQPPPTPKPSVSAEKAEKVNQQWAKDQAVYKMRLGLECPAGGASQVEIHNRLGRETGYVGTSNGTKLLFRRQTYVVRAINSEGGPVDIHDPEGVVVRNMCPKGTITLVTSMPPLVVGRRTSWWMATGLNRAGLVGEDMSPTASLLSGNGNRGGQRFRIDRQWIIRIGDVTGGFFDQAEPSRRRRR